MTDEANGEVRVAVVLYGGVSLAVHMSAVCEESLRLVRGTADAPGALDEVETIYRELSNETKPAGGRSRVLVDIITDTIDHPLPEAVQRRRTLTLCPEQWTKWLLQDHRPSNGRLIAKKDISSLVRGVCLGQFQVS